MEQAENTGPINPTQYCWQGGSYVPRVASQEEQGLLLPQCPLIEQECHYVLGERHTTQMKNSVVPPKETNFIWNRE